MVNQLKHFFLFFSAIFFLSSVTCFTAYNWNEMSSLQKLSVPSFCFILTTTGWFIFNKELYRNLSLFTSCFIIGTIFAVFGQVYQTGADSYTLFINWSIFLIIPSLISSFYPLYFLLIAVLTTALILYQRLYVDYTYILFYSSLFLGTIVVIYPFIIDKFKLIFNNIFYNLIVSIFFIFLLLSTGSNYFSHNNLAIFSYYFLFLIGTMYFLGYFIYKKNIVKVFSILYSGFFIWSILFTIFAERFLFRSLNLILIFLLFSLVIFIITISLLLKSLPKDDKNFVKQFFVIPILFLKSIILIFILSILLIFIWIFFPFNNTSFLFIGIIFLFISIILPKQLNFSEDKSEIFSFLVGISFLNYFYSYLFSGDTQILVYLPFILFIIFILFWYFRPSKGLDYFFIPALCLSIYNFIYISLSHTKYYDIIHIFLLICSFFSLCFITFYEKIQNNKIKLQIERIFIGNEITILFIFLSSYTIHLSNSTTLISKMFVFLTCLLSIFKGTKKEKKSLIITILIIVSILNFLCLDYLQFSFTIMLILINILKNHKAFIYFFSILLIFFISEYYYNTGDTLFDKSIALIFIAIFLFISYFISQYVSKGGNSNEQ